MPIQVPVVQTGLEQSIQQAAAKAGKNLRINMGPGAKSIESLSKPLGRLTGKADEFTKSMEAANARVLAFGASVGVIAAVSKGLQELVKTTIEVEKNLANINSILRQTESQLDSFKNQIFDIARNTGQTFDTVAEAALELSRQGLKAEEVTKRLNDALVLSRLSGLSAADSVAGLTAAVNSFSSAGLTTTEVLNKISAAAASAAVSDRDLIEGLKRSGAVAVASGVQFDELIGIISALQERTARGGAVIGNSLKTIFTRIQDIEKLNALQDLGVQVTDLSGQVLSSNKIIENLAPTFAKLDQASKVNLADNLVGKFQIAPFLALLEDYNLKVSRSGEVAATSFNATNEAYQRNEALSKTLADAVNVATVNLKELANTLGEIGVTDSLKNIIGVFNSVVSSIQDVLDGDGIGSQFAKGLIKGISAIISGPGLALALVAIGKLLLDFAKFGAGALKTFFGLNKAAEAQKNLQGQIAASLLNDKGIRSAILSIEKQNISEGEKKKLQTQFFTKALNEQLAVMQKMQGIARTVAPGVMAGTASRRGRRAAGGFLPIGAESSDISRGVGGAPASAKPVVIPNFAFGGGKRGTMVANDSEYIVPNYANGGDAIFNQNMVSSMGLPANARKVRAAGGYIPNFARQAKPIYDPSYAMLIPEKFSGKRQQTGKAANGKSYTFDIYGIDSTREKLRESQQIKDSVGKFSIGLSQQQARTMTGGLPNADKINKLANQGAIGGLAGAIFETAISALIKSPDFDLGETASFDFIGKNSIGRVSQISPSLAGSAVSFLEAKIGLNSKTANSMANKIARFSGSGGKVSRQGTQELLKAKNVSGMKDASRLLGGKGLMRSASGYIPNFADPLQDAIGREQAAGLPISQIRVNQSGKLRNAQNPMGLAVTNTRDEPTGAIPNFVSGAGIQQTNFKAFEEAAKSQNQVTKANRDYLGIIFGVQAGMTALSAATSGAESGVGKFVSILSGSLSSITSFAFAGQAASQLGDNLKQSGGKFKGALGGAIGKLGVYGAALGAAFEVFKFGKDLYNEFSGATKAAETSVALMSDAAGKAATVLGKISEQEKVAIKFKTEEAFDTSFFGEDAEAIKEIYRDFNTGKLMQGGINLQYESGIEDAAKEVFKRSLEAGLDEDLIKRIFAESARKGGETFKMEKDELISVSKKITNILNNVSTAFQFIDKKLDGVSSAKGLFSLAPTIQEQVQEEYGLSSNQAASITKQRILQKIEEESKKNQADTKKVETLRLKVLKARIKEQIESFSINQKQFSETKKQILAGEALGNLTEERKRGLEFQLGIEKLNSSASQEIANGLLEQLSSLEGMNAEKLASLGLEEKISKALIDGNITRKESLAILDQAGVALGKQDFELGEQKMKIEQIISAANNRRDTEIEIFKNNKAIEDSLARQKRTMDDIRSGMELSGKLEIGQSKLDILDRNFSTREEQERLKRGSGAMSIAQQRASGISSAELELKRVKFEQQELVKQAEIMAGKIQNDAMSEPDSIKQQKMLADASLMELTAERNAKAAIASATAQLQVAKEAGLFKDALTLATDAVTNLGPELEQLRMTEKTAGTFRGRKEAELRRKAIEASIEKGGTPEEILARINQEPLTRSYKDRMDLLKKSDLEISSKLKDDLIQGSYDFAHNIGNAMLDAIQKGENLGDVLLGTAAEFLNLISRAFMKSAVNDLLGSFGVGKQGGGPISGGSGTKDDVPAMLMGGEFVMNKKAVRKYGMGFMSALNNGSLQGFASGGQVKDREGMFTTPGMNGAGAIEGAANLLSFATQTPVALNRDTITSSGAFLDAESGRMTMFGRRNNPQFQKVQDAKRQAFDLYASEMNARQQAKEQEKASKKALMDSLKGAAISAGVGALIKTMGAGFKAGFSGTEGSFVTKLGAGLKGTIFGGNDIAGQSYGGLSNLFTGRGFQSGPSGLGSGFTPKSASVRPKSQNIMVIDGIPHPMDGLNHEDLYDTDISKMGLLPKKATGGLIPAAGGVDTVPAMLSGGEFVMNAAATRNIGAGNLQALNSGAGVDNTDLISKLDELILATEASQSTGEINITVNGSNGTDTQTSGQDTTDQQRQLSERIKVAVKQVIADEQRLGGQLRR